MNLAFIGGGVMAEAMISGVIGARLSHPSDISIGEPVQTRRKYLTGKFGVVVTPNNTKALDSADIVVLAVKPQQLPTVMLATRSTLIEGQVVLSIVAGATIDTLTNGLNHSAIIRVMPNTPAQIGAGMTVWTASGNVPQEKISVSKKILRTLGDELYVDNESFVDMATALSASGPAYVFLFMEALIDAGVHMGMSREMARRLSLQTVLGSAKLAFESGTDPATLRNMVTSPGGTTAEALRAFESGRFRAVVLEAVQAAYDRSKELGGGV
jgi:pyrroline-5-carboxylate reductase